MAVSSGAAAAALAPAATLARDVIGAAELAWAPAAGEVGAYVVFVSRGGGPYRSEQYTRAPRARVGGRPGETVQVLVRAYALSDGRALASAPSEPSEPIRFVPAEPPASAVSAAPPSLAPPAPMLSQLLPAVEVRAGGDFDGDGDLDLVATVGSWEHPIALFLKRGSLDQLVCLAPLHVSGTASATDFDGDGRDELAVQNGAGVSLIRLERSGVSTVLRRAPLALAPGP
jgi:hypothetical protein